LLSSNNPNEVGAFAQGINSSGVVSGAWQQDVSGDPDDPASYTMHGFVATPLQPKK